MTIAATALLTPAQAADKTREVNIGGYLSVGHSQVPATFNAGFSFYSAAWPLVEKYQGHRFQSGPEASGSVNPQGAAVAQLSDGGAGWKIWGKEAGYVPIATLQEWGGSATEPRGQ